MKILLISTTDSNGAGLCAYRILKSLQQMDIDAKMLVLHKWHKSDDSVVQFSKSKVLLWRVCNKVRKILHLWKNDTDILLKLSNQFNCTYSLPVSPFDISNHPLVRQADIIHLHWINNFIDYTAFFSNVKHPIVWTLHDENLFFGISHYSDTVLESNPLEKKYHELKRQLLQNKEDLGIVFLSKMMFDKFKGNDIIKSAKKTIIHNSVNPDIFIQHDRKKARESLGLEEEDIILIFVATLITDRRKGLSTLISAVEDIQNSHIKILAVGDNPLNFFHQSLITLGRINDINRLSLVYSSADYLVMPSLKEAFAQTPIEAMSCGLPAVVFPVSGTEELINEYNGIRCNGFEVKDLKLGLLQAMGKTYDGNKIRQYVMDNFSPSVIARQYIEFYEKFLR